jgi:hypothetical protein
MLTEKEIKFLNFLYKKLKGAHLDYSKAKEYIKKTFKLDDKSSFELAYLYDKNFDDAEDFVVNREGDGTNSVVDFNNVAEPERMSYEEYQEKVPWQVKVVMEIIKDENPDNYEFDGDSIVEYEGDEYVIYESQGDLSDTASNNFDPCNNIDSYDDLYEGYFYISDTDKRITASEEADHRVDNMDDRDIIRDADIQDKIDALDELDNLKEQIESKTEEMEELVHQLDDVSEEEKNDLEERITNFETEIEELEGRVEEIESEGTREEIIDNAREELKSSIYDEIYDELDNDPIEYFRERGYDSIDSMVDNTLLQFDCTSYSNDEFENADVESLGYMAGYSNTEEVRVEGKGWIIVAW